MTFAFIGETIRTTFDDLVATPESLATQYQNEPFTPPADDPWASVFIIPGESRQASLGPMPRFRTVGVLAVQLYAPIASGDGILLALTDTVTAAFRGQTIGGIVFRAPAARSMGRDSRWWRWDVTTGFFVDEIGG